MKDLDISSTSDPPKFGSCILGHLSLLLLYCEGKKTCLSPVTFFGVVYITSLALDSTKPCLSPGFIPQPTETAACLIFISQYTRGMTSRQIFHKILVRKKHPPHLKQQQLRVEGPPRSNLSTPVENYSSSVTDMHCCQTDEFDGCATGTDSLNHF